MEREVNAKAKYLKYKAKYEQLKQQLEQQDGGFGESGWYTFITSQHLANQLNLANFFKKDAPAPSMSEINKLLDKKAFRIKSFSRKLDLVMVDSALVGRAASFFKSVDTTMKVLEPRNTFTSFNIDADLVKNIEECINANKEEQLNRNKNANILTASKEAERQAALKEANFFNLNNKINLDFDYLAANEKAWNSLPGDRDKIKTDFLKRVISVLNSEANKMLVNRVKQNIAASVPSRQVNDISFNYFVTINMSAFGKNMVKEVGTI